MVPDTNIAASIATTRIITTFDDMYPSVDDTFFRIRGNQGQYFFKNLMDLGFRSTITNDTGIQYEEDWIRPIIHTAGALTVVDLANRVYSFVVSNASPNDYLAYSSSAPYPAAPALYAQPPVKVNDRLEMPKFDGGVRGTVIDITSIGTNTAVVIFKLSRLTDGPLTVGSYVAGTTLIIDGNAFEEDSDQPEGLVHKPLQDRWYAQIIKTTYKITGSMLTTRPWYTKISDSAGATVGYRFIGQRNMEYLHADAIDDAILWEYPTTNPTTVNGSVEVVKTTEGAVQYAIRKGHNIPYAAGTFGVSYMDALEKVIDSEMAPNYYALLQGIDLNIEMKNSLSSFLHDTNIDFIREKAKSDLFGNNEGMYVAVNFTYMQSGNHTFCFTRMPQFSFVRGHGAPGYDAQGLGIGFPIGTKADQDPNNRGNRIPYMGFSYRAMDGYSRMAEVVDILGATNGTHMTSRDRNNYGLKSHIAARHCGGNAWLRLYRV